MKHYKKWYISILYVTSKKMFLHDEYYHYIILVFYLFIYSLENKYQVNKIFKKEDFQ